MQFAGSPPWRFAEGGGQLVAVALFVRDAVGFIVPPADDNPPPLARPVPDRSAVLEEQDRAIAGRQWLSWWRQILAERTRPDRGERATGDARARVQGLSAGMEWLANPPTFNSLAGRPELRVAVTATFAEACRWESAAFDPQSHKCGHFGWATIKQVAEDVAFDRQVSLDAIDGKAVIVDVDGPWWLRIFPGVALCSVQALADPLTSLQQQSDDRADAGARAAPGLLPGSPVAVAIAPPRSAVPAAWRLQRLLRPDPPTALAGRYARAWSLQRRRGGGRCRDGHRAARRA